MELDFIKKLIKTDEQTKIVLLVMDGLGGLPVESGGPTELEAANTPNLDKLATEGICGLHIPIGAGITPGSGPAHQALFGYNPIKYQVGRGVLSALGIDFDLGFEDVAARGNFCTIDDQGLVSDRRAGRISTDKNIQLLKLLRQIKLDGAQLFLDPVKEYRFLMVLRGKDLSGQVTTTDPQETGVPPLPPKATTPEAQKTADLVSEFVDQARDILADHHPANMVLLRGFSMRPKWPTMEEVFGVRSAAIAAYPMYRGVAKLVGMKTFAAGDKLSEEFDLLEKNWNDFDYFFVHVKKTDSYGEDGDFDHKAALIEEVDGMIPRLLDLNPDVVIVTGDHSTPSLIRYHGWQPVPVLLWSKYCRADEVTRFGERACMRGGLGPRLPATDLMPIALANASRLEKFGA
jgi:2,3-bisphosphoglycerate-independent phosphoglycerate mutase